jgi:methionyl-tRNA formyltransferase
LDTGPVVDMVDVSIERDETAGSLLGKLELVGAKAIVAVLQRLEREGALTSTPQPSQGATYANKVSRDAAAVDWTLAAVELDRKIRAFDPVPGAHASLGGEPLKIWAAQPRADGATQATAGTVVAISGDAVDVACGTGVLRLAVVQPAGGRRMPAAAWAAGRAVRPGVRFSTAAAPDGAPRDAS